MGFMTSFNLVPGSLFHCFYEQAISIPHVISTSFKDSISLFSKGVPVNNKSQAKGKNPIFPYIFPLKKTLALKKALRKYP